MEHLGKGMTFKVLDYCAKLLPRKASGNWQFQEENMAVLIFWLKTPHCWWWGSEGTDDTSKQPAPLSPCAPRCRLSSTAVSVRYAVGLTLF